MFRECCFDDTTAGSRQMDVKTPTIRRVLDSFDKSFFFQSINGSGHRAAGQQNLFTDHLDGKWPFVQQNLHNGEIAQV